MSDLVQVFTAVGSKHDAEAIAAETVGNRLAACVQILGPITSTYWWQGNMETEEEWLCLLKSTQDHYEALEAAIRKVHPYDVPEILAVPVIAGHRSYIEWCQAELGTK